ncbi:MAG: type I DNA topoisomerase [Gammaproteobacteria bacterium]|nr:type I DNA topoisomerase [Gammaproteobacteria bacterium]
MARSLVIVESPAKAKTINKYLGKDFVVRSSVGHIRDLPTGGSTTDAKDRAKEAARTKAVPLAQRAEYKARRAREQLIKRMGVDPENGWAANYQVLPGKEKVVSELSRLASSADMVYLATDMDREGEAIAWHLRETIGGDASRFRRVVFNEITRKAIQEAFAEPGELNMNRVNAQQARRFLDRVVGFELSPLLWAKVARGLSAGRVQSVAVRLVVEREREIRAFIPEEYWEAFVDLARPGTDEVCRFQLARLDGENFRPDNREAANVALAKLQLGGFKVSEREDKPTRTRPNAPFITSTLQQAASTRLGFSVKKTMTMAQRLYEAGHITYMRTDSTNLSAEAVGAARDFIQKTHGDAYLPDKPRVYASKKDAQEAHEAIRPSNVGRSAAHLYDMEADAQRLYDLIWRQFVACQMPDAEYLSTTVTALANRCEVRLRGRILTFDGYTRVLPPQSRRDEELEIPNFAAGEALDLRGAETIQHFTKPPPRFGEASLVRELEKRGIGRPSTYAAIISTIQERGYVTLQNRRFYAEKIGELVTDRLVEKFQNLMDYGFTADMEAELDRIAEGDLPWREVLDQFYGDFENKLDHARLEQGGMRANDPTDTDIACPACGRHMQIRTGSTGVFLGCSGYALPPKERCTHTINLIPGEEAIDVDADEEGESRLLRSRQRCPVCSTTMTPYLIDEDRKLHVCDNNPDCGGFRIEAGTYRIKGYDGPLIACEKCGSDMQLKSGRFGKYFGCTNTECGNTRKLLRNGEAAPPKADPIPMPELRCEKVDDFYLLRDGASGLFLAASQFPKHRETRAPLIRELKSHTNELDPKFGYLLSAPEADPEGRPAVLRFSRKTREQYVQSEVEGKPAGWRAFFADGRWVEVNGGADTSGDGEGRTSRGKASAAKTLKAPPKKKAKVAAKPKAKSKVTTT